MCKQLYLNVSNNSKITNVNHIINLKILCARQNCGIDNNGIKNIINLEELNVNRNPKITNINHMINLKKSYMHMKIVE